MDSAGMNKSDPKTREPSTSALTTLFILPLILAGAYLNMGQSSCGGGNNTLKCQGVPVTHTFDAQDGSTQSGTSGDDVILVLAGPATILAGAGDDLVCVIGPQDDIQVYGGSGDDQIWGGPGSGLLNGGSGDDALRGEGGDDVLDAGNSGEALDWLDGGPGDDVLYGDGGVDVLIGGDGNDAFWSGDEGTILDGGAGYDTAFLCADNAIEEVEQTLSMYANQRCKRVTNVRTSPATLYADELESGPGTDDRPYFGFIKFSSQFGVPGSTTVEFIDQHVGLSPVGDILLALEGTGPISGGIRAAEFPESIQQQLDFGPRFIPKEPQSSSEGVWIDGILILAMESDDVGWSPNDGVRDQLIERAGCLDTTLRNNVETVTQWSVGNFLVALNGVRGDLASACDAFTIGGGGALGRLIKEGFRRLALLFVDPDDPMGTAFVVRLGVPDAYFNDNVAPLVGIPQTRTCNDGSEETFVAGCTPFLANPCEMKEDPDAISQYASFCPSAPTLSGIGLRYPRVLEIPFERGDRGKWRVRFDL